MVAEPILREVLHAPPPAHTIVDIVALMQTLREEDRPASSEERELLGRWMGWGPVRPAFEAYPKGQWKQIHDELHMLLGEKQMEHASGALLHSYFTDRYMVDAIWRIATELGFDGGKVLEPGCGNGHFLEAAPQGLPIDFVGIEREPFTASVAQMRFPAAKILATPLEKTTIIEDSVDLVIGNVPFADVGIADRQSPLRFSLHNYFFWRALRALHPGGLAILISTHYTMDAINDGQREALSKIGNFLGAIRLPSGAHKAAGTQVVSDIIVLQKKHQDIPWSGHNWMETGNSVDPAVATNCYFNAFPERVVGTQYADHGLHRYELCVRPPADLVGDLHEKVSWLISDIRSYGAHYVPRPDYTKISSDIVTIRGDGRKEGSFHLVEKTLFQVVDGELVEVKKCVDELSKLARLRDAAVALLEAERDHSKTDLELVPLRAMLNDRYDEYVKKYTAIHRATVTIGAEDPETGLPSIKRRRPTAMYMFSRDPDYAVVLGLEDYDEDEPDEKKRAKKAPIFFKRVNIKPEYKDHADSPTEAIALCLDQHGRFVLEEVATYLSIEPEEVPGVMGEFIYENPVTREWELAVDYLSGNVRIKLEDAEKAEKREPDRFTRNVEALRKIQPEDLPPEDIHAILGAPWISTADIERFALEVFQGRVEIKHEPITSTWSVIERQVSSNAAASSEWGTKRMSAFKLLEKGLNKKVPVVYDHDSQGNSWKNEEETLAAQDKLRQVQEKFSEWVWQDDERARRLAAVYNKTFNASVARKYDGSHMTFPGMSDLWQNNLYSWQKDFPYMAASTRACLCAYPVGAGKTTIEVAVAMTLKRLKLVSKAAIVVPDHLLEQITSEAQRLYPGANILMIGRDDLSRERRKIFAARIATGNYDFVVMTHTGLSAIRVHPDTEKAYIEQRIALHREALEAIEEDESNKRSIKRIEKSIARLEQKLNAALDRRHDDGVTFEQLGISYLIIDECHLYKNLGLPSNIQDLQVQGSQRAADLEMKLRYLEEKNGDRPFAAFFSATPISNSMVEAYVMAWYLYQKYVIEAGMRNLDAFASVFMEFATNIESTVDGSGFRMKTRPTRFVNMPELQILLSRFADIRDSSMLDSKRPKKRDRTVVVEPSDVIREGVADLVERSGEIARRSPRKINGKEDNMLWVTTDGKRLALDPALLGLWDPASPKLSAITREVIRVYEDWQQRASHLPGEFKSLQIIFCDLGTPSEEKGTQVYGKLKSMLAEAGIPRHGIRFIHDAKKDADKAVLFEQCRTGKVAVLIGSTGKMGTGTNIQTRAVALHHAEPPWRPDEVEQRNGRAHRPGNLYPEVEILQYVIPGTFDAYSWQILLRKAIFAGQIYSGKLTNRTIEIISDDALTYGQVKAAATGDPLVLEQATVDMNVTRLLKLQSAFMRERRADQDIVYRAQDEQESAKARIALLTQTLTEYKAYEGEGFITYEGEHLKERTEIGEYVNSVISKNMFYGGTVRLGTWSSVRLTLEIHKYGKDNKEQIFYVYVGGTSPDTISGRLHIDPKWLIERKKEKKKKEEEKQQSIFLTAKEKAILEAKEKAKAEGKEEEEEEEEPKVETQRWRIAYEIEQFFAQLEEMIANLQERLKVAQQREQEYSTRIHIPFPQNSELQEQLSRKRALDAYVSMSAKATDPKKLEELASLRLQLLEQLGINPDGETVEDEELPPIAPPRMPDGSTPVIVIEGTPEPEPAPIVVEATTVVEEPVIEPEPIVVVPVKTAEQIHEEKIQAQIKVIQRHQKERASWDDLLRKVQQAEKEKNAKKRKHSRKPAQDGATLFDVIVDSEEEDAPWFEQTSLF